ncbi:hypothetical protein [Methylobacterium marchantiae]|uniref:Uncharacterized protein n=1 Tax=Methylobacterium marchantiae TaxID=600331 RepID=A0ABW3WYC0_9HYPH|nr:hypothetical protein AIGOOFII_2823 [Methylobacterium marchantiae]
MKADLKHANPSDVATLVRKIVGSSPFAKALNGVDVEASNYDDEGEFLRILIHFKNLDELSEDDVDTITSSIEGEISKKDDRFPSVRFSEP